MKTVMRLLIVSVFALLGNIGMAQHGKVLQLDGDKDYMSVDDHDDLDINSGESFSITCWAKTYESADFYRIASKRSTAANGSVGYEMITNKSGGEFGINLKSTAGTNAGPPFGTTSITDGKWHHLALVFDAQAKTSRIYVDGILEKSQNSTAIGSQEFSNNVPLLFGTAIDLSVFWNGWLDEIRIWSKALTAGEITADMPAIVTGTEDDLIAAWDFEDVKDGIAPDITGNHPGRLLDDAKSVDPDSGGTSISAVIRYQPAIPTGQGNKDERMTSANFKVTGSGNNPTVQILRFKIDPDADAHTIGRYKLYYNGNTERLNLSVAELLGEANVTGGYVEFSIDRILSEGNNVFWLCADILDDTPEGSQIGCWLSAYTVSGVETAMDDPASPVLRTVLLQHQLLFSGGDFGSATYRIPAIASRGDRIVVVADARINNNGDLPNNIDLFARYSEDGGKTWSGPVTVADFGSNGASDPALVYDRNSGDLLCLFASHNGLFASTPNNKIRFNVARSKDFGKTWEASKEFSNQIYQSGWYAAWTASGSAHQMESGRIVAAVGARKNSSNVISNFMIYSDDGGLSWNTAGQASTTGDEAKIVELDDGRLLMAIRTPGKRRITHSSDGGNTWETPVAVTELVEPGVNGDLVRYTSVRKGFDKSRLLFSIPNSPTQRRNLTVFISYDEGATWPVKRVISPIDAAYSALTIFDDGTIGIFYENGEYENYQLNFARFSLEWLSEGKDSWSPSSAVATLSDDDDMLFVSPNPASSAVEISYMALEGRKSSIEISDVSGRLVKRISIEKPGRNKTTWHHETYTGGVYFVKLITGGKAVIRKVMIVK